MRNPYLLLILRLALGSLFIWASIDKIAHPAYFARAIDNYHILPAVLIPPFAAILPFVELLAGSFLFLGLFSKENSLIITVLLLIFFIALSTSLARGIDASCGCFKSAGGDPISLFHIFRDLSFLAASSLVLFFESGKLGLDRFRRNP